MNWIRALAVWAPLALCGVSLADSPAAPTPPSRAEAQTTAAQGWQEDVFFYLFAGLTVGSALGVVVAGNVIRMAMWLFAAFGAVAMMFFLLQAYYVGVIQLIVYVGGILVLIVFGIMLTSSSPSLRFEIKKGELVGCGIVSIALFAGLTFMLLNTDWHGAQPATESATVAELGRSLLTDYLVPFEVASVLLLVVMIGAAFLAKQEKT